MKNKLSLFLVSLMCFAGCNKTDNSTSTNSSNVSNSSNLSSNSSNLSSSTSSSSTITHQYAFSSLESKKSFLDYEQYKSEQTNKEDEFFDRTINYQVGDDNEFGFKPQLTLARRNVSTGEIDFVYNADWEYVVSLYLLENEDYKLVDLDTYVESIDTTNCLIDFNAEAVGNTFKLSLYPTNLSETQMADPQWTKEYILDVLDGYNVTSAKELAYIQNHDGNMKQIGSLPKVNYKTIWDEFKTENGLELDYEPTSLILHDNISITVDDIPSEYFYSTEDGSLNTSDSDYDRANGSLKDYMNIYQRDLKADEDFIIEGNYFSINANSIPTVVRANNEITAPDKIISHATLFRFEGKQSGNVTLRNTKLIGNSPRKENVSLSGGLIMNKVEGPQFTSYNNIAIRWFISFFPNQTQAPYLVDSCRAYNNFNSFVYSWGCGDVTLRNSEFKIAGGPVIIQDHLGLEDSDSSNDKISSTKIENCVLESIVTGTEGWFNIMGASALVPQIKALDAAFNLGGRSFLKVDGEASYFNFITLNKSGEAEAITTDTNVKGSVSIKNDTTDTNFTFNYGETGATNPLFGTVYNSLKTTGAPVFETSAGGMAYINADTSTGEIKGLFSPSIDLSTGTVTQNNVTGDTTNAIHMGEYICLYYSGMQIVFEYYNYEV